MYNLSDVTILPTISDLTSRSEVDLDFDYYLGNSNRWLNVSPVIVSNLDATGTIEMAEALYDYNIQVALHKYIPVDKLIEFFEKPESDYTWYSMGIKDEDLKKFEEVNSATFLDMVHIDTPNGYMTKFHDFIKRFLDKYPEKNIMAGNVCTPEGVEALANAGANVVKVGIAQGGWCDTKNKASIGIPQLSAIMECRDACVDRRIYMCSDGGVKTPAHISNAICGGADMVMCGNIFCGYEECNKDNWEMEYEMQKPYWDWGMTTIEKFWTLDPESYNVRSIPGDPLPPRRTGFSRKKRLKVYGMASRAANDKYNGGLAEYRASEGKEGYVEYKGKVAELAQDIRGSLASTCTYTNNQRLQQLVGAQRFCYL